MNKGVFKFNNGNGALLCGKCRTIVVYGLPNSDFYYCKKCREYVENPVDK